MICPQQDSALYPDAGFRTFSPHYFFSLRRPWYNWRVLIKSSKVKVSDRRVVSKVHFSLFTWQGVKVDVSAVFCVLLCDVHAPRETCDKHRHTTAQNHPCSSHPLGSISIRWIYCGFVVQLNCSSNPQQIQPVEFEPNYAIQKHRLPCEDFQNKEKLTW